MAADTAAARVRPRRTSTLARRWSPRCCGRAAFAASTRWPSPTPTPTTWAACPPSCATSIPPSLWVGNNPRFGAYNALLDEAADLHVRLRSLRAGDALSFGSNPDQRPRALQRLSARPEAHQQRLAWSCTWPTAPLPSCWRATPKLPSSRPCWLSPAWPDTLLKVGHHGSITSTRPEFLARVLSAMGRHLLRPAQPLRPSPPGSAPSVASRQSPHL